MYLDNIVILHVHAVLMFPTKDGFCICLSQGGATQQMSDYEFLDVPLCDMQQHFCDPGHNGWGEMS